MGQPGMGMGGTGMGNTGMGSMGSGTTGSTSSGMFGSRTTGNGIQSNGSASQFGNSGGGSGMMSQGQNGQNGQALPGSGSTQGARYTREGRQPGQFVGADRSDTVNLLQQSQQAINGMQGLQAGNQQQFNPNANGQNNRPKVRTTLRIAPELKLSGPVIATSPVAAAQMQVRMANTPHFQRVGPVQVSVEGRTAILRGTVASDHARVLAERVALLEPGISAVRNELSVGQAVSTGQ